MASIDKPVVIYDGQCKFCLGQIAKMKKCDRRCVFDYLPRQTENLLEQFPVLENEEFDTGLRLVTTENRVMVGADAVYEIYRRFKPYKYLTWIYKVPLLNGLFKKIYQWIAKNRYRLKGKCDEGCEI